MKKTLLLFAAAAVVFSGLIIWLRKDDSESLKGKISVSEALSGADTAGYKRALHPVEFVFPGDHGPHEGFKTEWWYFTGNLDAADGRHLGYQLTIFRTSVTADTLHSGSVWRSKDIYMGHFTVTDAADKKFYSAERLSRSGNKLAGAASSPFSVWLYDWMIKGSPDGLHQTGGNLQLSAEENGI
ncbi:MAG: lipocalin-like domain-containing protein, partial [Syntrophothermus sp.]